MATDKKSFVLYCDLIHTVKKLPPEKAGELLLTILKYVNDENPTVTDLIVDLVFEPIKQQLKRDLKKYEGRKGAKSEAGKLGNLKRYHSDIYNNVISEKITLDEGLKLAKTRKDSHTDAKLAVNVNDNVNDNVIVSVNVNEINIKKEILNSQSWLDGVQMKFKRTDGKYFLEKFLDNQEILVGEGNGLNRNIEDVKNHFVNWYGKQSKQKSGLKY